MVVAMVLIGVSLVGIVLGFHALFSARANSARQTWALILLDQKLSEIQRDGMFREGVSEGAYEEPRNFSWATVTEKTDNPVLYRIQATVTGPDTKESVVVYQCVMDQQL